LSDFLAEMSAASLARAREAKEGAEASALDTRVATARPPVVPDFTTPGFDIIAEAKLKSPSEGVLVSGGGTERVVELARTFHQRGAAAISVLTEETRFGGSLDHLGAASDAVPTAVMRKDFLVDPVQILEARAAGASGVLLIARLLPESLLVEMTEVGLGLGMFVVVEVFDRSDLETAVPVFEQPVLVGVNCRDLGSLEVDPGRFSALAPHLPDHLPAVAESGIGNPDDVAAIAALGYRLALVGSALVTAVDPGGMLEQMISAGRSRAGDS